MLVELGWLEQRHKAVIEVMNGATIVDVPRRYGVSRQTIHDWLRRYPKAGGVAGPVDHSCKPGSCPHQMAPATEARIVALRRDHPSWGPQRLRHELTKEGLDPSRAERRSTGRSSATAWSTGSDHCPNQRR